MKSICVIVTLIAEIVDGFSKWQHYSSAAEILNQLKFVMNKGEINMVHIFKFDMNDPKFDLHTAVKIFEENVKVLPEEDIALLIPNWETVEDIDDINETIKYLDYAKECLLKEKENKWNKQ